MILKSENNYNFIFKIIISLILLAFFAAGLFFVYFKNKDSKESIQESAAVFTLEEPEIEVNKSEAEKKDSPISFLFFGDLMLDRHVGEIITKKGLGHLFEDLDEEGVFQNKNIVSANLEGAVADGGAHYPPNNIYDFSFSPEIIGELKKYNFNFFNLANNHFFDQGERGIIETRKNLADLDIGYVGCKDRAVDDCSVKILEINDKKIGLAGFSMVYGTVDLNKAEKLVKSLRASSSLVIVNMHWGVEYAHQYNKVQAGIAYKLIEAGADIIVGHHPHVVQGMEIYQGKPIFYSLGNFIFDQYFSPDTQEGLALEIILEEGKIKIKLLPIYSSLSRPRIASDKEREGFFEKFLIWSRVDEEIKEQIKSGEIILTYEN